MNIVPTKSIHIYQHKPNSTIPTQSKIKIKIRTQTQIKHKNTNSEFLSTKHKHKLISNKNTKTSQTQQSTINKPTPRPTPTTNPPFDPPLDPTDHCFTTINHHHTDLSLSLNPYQNYGRLWKGEEIRRASRKGNRGGRDTDLRQRDPPREKDTDLSPTQRERERERERERAKH